MDPRLTSSQRQTAFRRTSCPCRPFQSVRRRSSPSPRGRLACVKPYYLLRDDSNSRKQESHPLKRASFVCSFVLKAQKSVVESEGKEEKKKKFATFFMV